jgi:EAL domain-containing protein (putative c-di-GMP-specific phosphodiesterase class I)
MEVLARAAATILEPGVRDRAERADIERRLDAVVAAGGPTVVLQPIVDAATGERVGAEALSRFPADWGKTPDVVFAEAHRVDRGDEFEIRALRAAAAHLDRVDGYVSMNVSPGTLLTDECRRLVAALPAHRVVLELSEHDQVADYDALRAVLAPLRSSGVRLAIDDVGAGFASLRHILLTTPDIIQLDRSIVAGIGADRVLDTLVRSLVDFARGCGSHVVAEGVETAGDAAALRAAGVHFGQGWHFGRPGTPEALAAIPDAATNLSSAPVSIG